LGKINKAYLGSKMKKRGGEKGRKRGKERKAN
jgi:hypothetical protein